MQGGYQGFIQIDNKLSMQILSKTKKKMLNVVHKCDTIKDWLNDF